MPRDTAPASVVVPAYNAAATIRRALESIAAQTLRPAEVIVVDDGSTDGTADAARSMLDNMGPTNLIVVTQDNKGASAARNCAIARGTQPYLAFLDADDEWLPEKLERSMQVMQNGDYLLVAHDYLDSTDIGDVHVDCQRRFNEGADPYVTLYLKGYIPSISVVTKRDAVVAAGGFDETLRNAQDFDLWLKLLAEPDAKFTLFGEALARYHHVEGSIMSHVERRIACCRIIAERYVPTLKKRGAPVIRTLWQRLAIIYAEAMRAQPDRKWRHALAGVGGLVDATLGVLTGRPTHGENSGPSPSSAGVVLVAGVWVFGVLGLYLLQYKHLASAVLRVLGVQI